MSKFKTKPFDHQMDALRESWDKEYWALLMEMGTGKTKVTIDTICSLHTKGKIQNAIIIAPSGVYQNWSVNELPKHMWDSVPYQDLAWVSTQTKASR